MIRSLGRLWRRTRMPLPVPPADVPPVPDLTGESLDRWLTFIRPTSEEWAWRKIPWRPTLWQGAVDARGEGKPLLLFTMNGHPIGAT